jgi:uracil-DNA glycosylase
MSVDALAAAWATLPAAWRAVLPGWTESAGAALVESIHKVSGDRPIGPADPFRAMRLVPPDAVKVVVFGQDPYPGPGHADGLAFSAPTSTRPSLRRIFDVLEADRPGWRRPASGRLAGWARQGVLLLNPVLTVELGRSQSHAGAGWQALTAQIVRHLWVQPTQPAFLLWGRHAQTFFDEAVGDNSRSCTVLRTRHPSHDFDRRFMAEGSHFLATVDRIDWWAISPLAQN